MLLVCMFGWLLVVQIFTLAQAPVAFDFLLLGCRIFYKVWRYYITTASLNRWNNNHSNEYNLNIDIAPFIPHAR